MRLFIIAFVMTLSVGLQHVSGISDDHFEYFHIPSRVKSCTLAILHRTGGHRANRIPVLFIHGATFPSALSVGFRMQNISWMDDMSERGYDTYALDFLGYGKSDRYPQMNGPANHDPAFSTGQLVAEDVGLAVDSILKRTGAPQVFLIGHSWGATVASYYAGKHPEKVRRLVLYAPFFGQRASEADTAVQAYHDITGDERVAGFLHELPQGEEPVIEPEVLTEWKTRWLASDTGSQDRHPQSVRVPMGWQRDLTGCNQGNCYYDPAKLTMPTLLVRGEWDQVLSHDDAGKLFEKLKNARIKRYVTIGKGTHVLHLEKNRFELYREVQQFLNEGDEPTPAKTGEVGVIFEVMPAPGQQEKYLDIAAGLKNELLQMDGFISIERFTSIQNPGKILSLSFWRDEESVRRWRNTLDHRSAQTKGRAGIFSDYRLRVVRVVRDYGMHNRTEAPEDSKTYHHTP